MLHTTDMGRGSMEQEHEREAGPSDGFGYFIRLKDGQSLGRDYLAIKDVRYGAAGAR